MAKYTGTGVIAASDFKEVKYVGQTKGGKAITIIFKKALNMGNIDWTFAEKNDTVAEIVFTAVYENTNETATSTTEPFEIDVDDEVIAGASEIMLGAGIFYIGDKAIALTRGGGQFVATRTFRNINADGDRGPVEGRIDITDSIPTLKLTALTILTRLADLYPALSKTDTTGTNTISE